MALTPEEEQMYQMLARKRDQTRKVIHILQVLDESSSMLTGREITVSAFNENLQDMSNHKDANVTVTLVKFNSNVNVLYQGASPDRAQPLNNSNFIPSGMTALYDAIGQALSIADRLEKGDHVQYLLQIFTDGGENSSREFNASRLKPMIELRQGTGKWTITVMGPHGSLDLFTRNLGVLSGNTVQFDASSVKSRGFAKSALRASTANYFAASAAGATTVVDSYSSIAPDGNVESISSGSK